MTKDEVEEGLKNSHVHETDAQLEERVAGKMMAMLQAEGCGLVVNIVKVPIKVHENAPPFWADQVQMEVKKKKLDLVIPGNIDSSKLKNGGKLELIK